MPQQENGVYVSPRRQGAGLVNAAAAISTPAYIDVDGKLVGKLELGDDPGWSGSYDLDFRVRSILPRIGVEQVLKPTLLSIPWEEMRTYPESFLLENCGRHQQMIDAVSAVLKQSK